MEETRTDPTRRSITSEGLSTPAVIACWSVSGILMSAGISATFLAGTGAAPAAMILFGSLFLVLALMKRVPLSLEVGSAKFDASYEIAEAFDAGREVGLHQGVQVAIDDVEKAEEVGEPPHIALERRRDAWTEVLTDRTGEDLRSPSGQEPGYRGPTACNAAGITYRQLDYWARTGLVEPGLRRGTARLYSEQDIILLRVIKQLLNAGISLQQIRVLAIHLRQRGSEDLDRVTLMSDGKDLYEATSPSEVIDLLNSGHGWHGIALGGVAREVREFLRELPSEPAE